MQKVENILKLVHNKPYAIEPIYGLEQVTEIIFNANDPSYFKELKTEQKAIEYYKDGQYAGSSSEELEGVVAVVQFSGTMTPYGGMCTNGMDAYDKMLRRLDSDKTIVGVIFKIDSGGGYIDAGTILYNSIKDFSKPLVVHTNFLGSAAVMGTLAADEIIAQTEMAEIGSVGVFVSMNKKMLEWYRVNIIDTYSADSNDKNKPFREIVKNNNFEPLKSMVTETDHKFMNLVKKHRPVSGDDTLKGGMFPANEAKKRGLIDSVGSFNYALKRINSLIQNK